MISITLDTRTCMSELLLRETFDRFLFIEGEITTFNKFTIDGYLHREFYSEDGMEEAAHQTEATAAASGSSATPAAYSTWDKLRDYCFSIIKGKRTPLDFRFIFSLSEDTIRSLIREKQLDFQPEVVQGLYLNFRFSGNTLTCTTGSSLTIFTLDKSLEHAFDQWTREFFSAHHIDWNEA